MKTLCTLATLVAAIVAVFVPTASARTPRTDCRYEPILRNYTKSYYEVRKLHGKRAPGRNIRKWGLSTTKHSKCKHLKKSIKVLKRMTMPSSAAVYVSTGRPYVPPAGTATIQAGSALYRIAQCESGGNPRAIGGGGAFRGKYQFTYSTWEGVGGSGDPAAASEAEQDKRAAILLARDGRGQWPVCGYR